MVGMTFLREREVYGSIYRADIIAWLVKHDAEKQFLVSFQDWKCQETLAWKYAKESCKWVEQDEDDELFVFYSLKYIIRKVKV